MDYKTIEDISFDDYQLQIKLFSLPDRNYYNYDACLYYVGNDAKMNLSLQEQKSFPLCLINLELWISNDKLTGSIDLDEENVFRYEIPYKVFLKSYYNNTRKYGLDKFLQTNKLKGIPQIILCILLSIVLENNLIHLDDTITLEASGEIESKDMIGLIRHYKSLGFKVVFPEYLKEGLESQVVPMESFVSTVLQVCNKKQDKINLIKKITKIS